MSYIYDVVQFIIAQFLTFDPLNLGFSLGYLLIAAFIVAALINAFVGRFR